MSNVENEIKQLINDGASAGVAVRQAFEKYNVDVQLEQFILDDVIKAYEIGGGFTFTSQASIDGLQKWWTSHVWPTDNFQLSSRISSAALRTNVVSEIKRSINAAEAWTKTARRLSQEKLVNGDVAGYMWDTIKAGRRALSGDKQAIKKFEVYARRAQRQIEQLAKSGAPTEYLKKAYENVIKQVEKGSAEGIAKGIERAVKSKARYNAERIARTERAKAWNEGFFIDLERDEDATGYACRLAAEHPKPDICDVYALSDFHGKGPGVYPKGRGPTVPHHPNCICYQEPVYTDKKVLVKDYDADAGKKYLRSVGNTDRKAIMGAKGAENFKKNPNAWKRNVRQYQEPHGTKPVTPKKYWPKPA